MSSIGTGVNLLFLSFSSYLKNGICFCCIPLADNRKRIFSLYVLSGHCACSMIFNIEYLFIALNVFKLLFKTKFTLIYLFLFANIGENSMLQIKYIFRLLSYFLFFFVVWFVSLPVFTRRPCISSWICIKSCWKQWVSSWFNS